MEYWIHYVLDLDWWNLGAYCTAWGMVVISAIALDIITDEIWAWIRSRFNG